MKLDQILNGFLESTGRDATIKGGRSLNTVDVQQKNHLINQLLEENKFNKWLIVIITLMFVVLFSVGIYFTIYYRDKPKNMGIVFGGSFLTMLGIMKALQNLWAKKCQMDMLLILIPGLSPEQTVVVIETLLHGKPVKEALT